MVEARRRGTTRSDLLVLAGQIDDKLKDARIDVLSTPRYIKDFQIDETAFEKVLGDERVSYRNPHAKERDINSVRSIYVLRKRAYHRQSSSGRRLRLSQTMPGSRRAAFQYGQKYEASRDVSSVITDFSLANMAWLKAPLGAPAVPMTELLAVSYAALQPSVELFEKYLSEIDKLEKQGEITARDHQLLRSSQLAQTELMNLTLGEEDALTEQTVTETLRRVTEEIKKEESNKYRMEREAHQKTQKQLAEQRKIKERVQERLYWRCWWRATVCAWCASTIIGVLLTGGLAAGVGLRSNDSIVGWLLVAASGVLILLTLGNLILGTSVRHLHKGLQTRCLAWFISRKAAEIGLDLTELQ